MKGLFCGLGALAVALALLCASPPVHAASTAIAPAVTAVDVGTIAGVPVLFVAEAADQRVASVLCVLPAAEWRAPMLFRAETFTRADLRSRLRASLGLTYAGMTVRRRTTPPPLLA